MRSKKQILVILSLIIVVIISAASKADTHWNLLEGIDPNPTEFKELVIGNKIVYWHQRIMDEAIVELDYIVYQFDKKTQELKDVKGHWREDLPPFFPELNVTKEQAESMVKGEVQFSQLFIISPESDIFSPIKPTPKNPCWVVVSVREVKGMLITVIDAVEGKVLGYGISPPSYTAFSLKGPQEENPCWGSGYWDLYYKNEPNGALYWFDEMGYTPEANEWPTEEKVKSHIQSDTTAMFYEIAHSRYTCGILFASGCVDGQCYELTTAEEIDDWISDYTKLPFTFIASCFGMCCTDVGTLSHAFRMGSTRDTATVGYCEMSTEKCLIDEEESCWSFARKWQRRLFECMNDGNTVKEAFDLANADYGACFNPEEGRACMRFAGDPNFAVVPIVPRVPPFPSLTIVDDVNDANCVYPFDSNDENYLEYTICYDGDGNEANDVVIVEQLPVEVDYYSSDHNGDYDPNLHRVTWELGNLGANDSNCVHLTVKVNQFAKPGSAFRNYCEIRNEEYSRNATEKTNVCCWDEDIIYVDANASGFNNGTCWTDAYTDLQDGLTGASNCECKDVIWVAGGTYKPTEHVWQEIATFQLVDGVDIYGGYPSGGGQRDPDAYETILSGDIDGNSTPDIYYVVSGADNAILDGFTVTMGRRGIYCKDCNDLTVTDCIITENTSDANANDANGVGIYCEDSSNLTVADCIISENISDAKGGGIYCQDSNNVTVTNCIITGNSASRGGGLFNGSCDPNVSNCIFTGNTTYYYGGGIYNNQSFPTVANCVFSGNSSDYAGGGMANYQSSLTLINCTFRRNFAYDKTPYEGGYGGGIYNAVGSSPNITNCIFWDNDAVIDGNEIYNYGDSDPNISYCDIEDSNGSGGNWDVKLGTDEGDNIDEDPCFMDVNTPTGSWTANASYDSSTYQSTLTDANASWSVDELAGKFIDPNTLQYLQFFIVSNDANTIKVWGDVTSIAHANDTYEIFDYRLSADSNCIDAGDPDGDYDDQADIYGEPREVNGRVDIGADEYYVADWVFCIKNGLGVPVAWFDDSGNLFLKGIFEPNTTPTPTDADEFRFQDSNSNDVAIIDANSGNMYIEGLLQAQWQDPNGQNDEFIIEDSNAQPVSYINDSGNVFLKGRLYDDIWP